MLLTPMHQPYPRLCGQVNALFVVYFLEIYVVS